MSVGLRGRVGDLASICVAAAEGLPAGDEPATRRFLEAEG